MKITIPAGQTFQGLADAAAKVNIIIVGKTASTMDGAILYQGQLGAAAATLVTAVMNNPAYITDITVTNTDSSVRTFTLGLGGTTGSNQYVPPMSLDALGWATYGSTGWTFYGAGGVKQTTSGGGSGGAPSGAAGGELAGTYPNPTIASTHSGSTHLALATNAVLLGTAAAAGAAGTTLRSNDTIAAFDATAPGKATPGAASVVGVVNFAARRDHAHQESGGVASIVAASAGINTTETQIVGFTIPANLLTAGSTFRLTAQGICTSTVANAATFRCRIGTSSLSGNIACAIAPVGTTTATSAPFMVDMLVTVRTTGAGGTVIGNGVVLANSASGALQAFTGFQTLAATTATVAVDTTANKIIELTFVSAATTTTLTFHNAAIDFLKM